MKDLILATDLADQLGISYTSLRKDIKDGLIKAIIHKKKMYIVKSSIPENYKEFRHYKNRPLIVNGVEYRRDLMGKECATPRGYGNGY